MNSWYTLVSKFHAQDNSDCPESLVLGDSNSLSDIAKIETRIGYTLPKEFKSFYTEYDGFGTNSEEGTDWFITPIESIQSTTDEARDWFAETHPDLAKRFVAFIDWGCGDYCGYLFTDDGDALDGIYTFEHESYEFEDDQDWAEFIQPLDSSLKDFLTV